MRKIPAWDNAQFLLELKHQKKKKKLVAQIGAKIIFFILKSSSVQSNLLV